MTFKSLISDVVAHSFHLLPGADAPGEQRVFSPYSRCSGCAESRETIHSRNIIGNLVLKSMIHRTDKMSVKYNNMTDF